MRKRRYGADHPRRVRLEDQDAMHYIIRARGVTKDTNHRSIIMSIIHSRLQSPRNRL